MMMNAEAISHELVAAGLPAKAAEVIAKNLANGSEYHVSAADFADFKAVTRDDFKQINAKLDKIREEVFAQKENIAELKGLVLANNATVKGLENWVKSLMGMTAAFFVAFLAAVVVILSKVV